MWTIFLGGGPAATAGAVAAAALRQMSRRPLVIEIVDPASDQLPGEVTALAEADYESFIAAGDPPRAIALPDALRA